LTTSAAQALPLAQAKAVVLSGEPWSVQFFMSQLEYTRHSFIT